MRAPLGVEASLTRSNQALKYCFKLTWRCSNSVFGEFLVMQSGLDMKCKTKMVEASTSLLLDGVFANAWNPTLAMAIGNSDDCRWTCGSMCNWKRRISYENDKPSTSILDLALRRTHGCSWRKSPLCSKSVVLRVWCMLSWKSIYLHSRQGQWLAHILPSLA